MQFAKERNVSFMGIIDISNPVTLILVLILILFLVFVGKTAKNSYIPAAGLIALLALLVYYVVCTRTPELLEFKKTIYNCMAINFVFIFIAFISYLWVDNIEAKIKNKKSYDNSLDWFWKKV